MFNKSISRCLDSGYVILLVILGHSLRESHLPQQYQHESPSVVLGLFVLLASIVAVNFMGRICMEISLFVRSSPNCLLGLLVAFVKHIALWNSLVFCADVYSIYVSYSLLRSGRLDWKPFKDKPVMISSLVLMRWTILATSFLLMEQVGRNMVPVVIAVTQPASLFFLLFLSFMIAGAFHAYYVFPIEGNTGDNSHWRIKPWTDNYVLNTPLAFDVLRVYLLIHDCIKTTKS